MIQTVAPGSLDAALAKGGTILLSDGVYTVTPGTSVVSGTRLIGVGSGRTIIVASASGVGADTSTNCMLSVSGALQGSATTLSALAAAGETIIALTSATGVSAGSWIYIEGNNSGTNSYDDSDGSSVILREMVRCSSVSGTNVTLANATRQYHASGVAAQVVVPNEGTLIQGVSFRAYGQTIAVGVLCQYARLCRLVDVGFGGFTRAGVELTKGTQEAELDGIRHEGGNNCVVYMDSVIGASLRGFRSSVDGDRYASSGVTRGLITMRHRCTEIRASDLDVAHGCIGIQIWGGNGIVISDVRCSDLQNQQAYTSMVTASELSNGAQQGVAIDCGAQPLAHAEFAHGVTVTGLVARNLLPYRYGGNPVSAAVYWHDLKRAHLEADLENAIGQDQGYGLGPAIVVSDTSGYVEAKIRNWQYGLQTKNVYCNVRANLTVYGNPATSNGATNACIPLYLDHQSGTLRVEHLDANSTTGVVDFGAEFTSSSYCIIDQGIHDAHEFCDAIVSYNDGAALTQGKAGVIKTGAAYTKHEPSSAASKIACAVVNNPSSQDGDTGWQMVQLLPARRRSRVYCSSAAVAVGDLIETAASGEFVANNASTSPVGVALTSKAGGAGGFVYIGPTAGA